MDLNQERDFANFLSNKTLDDKCSNLDAEIGLAVPLYGVKEEDEFLWDHHRPHPMCIPHIVDNILSYLAVPEWRCCRLVNSQYNEIACRNLRRNEVITFNKMSHVRSYMSVVLPSSTSTAFHKEENDIQLQGEDDNIIQEQDNVSDNRNAVERFVKKPQNTAEILDTNTSSLVHTSFHFNFDPDETEAEVESILETFFDKLGHQICELQFTTDLIPLNFAKRLPHMGDIWKGRVNNLETLSLEIKWGCPALLFENEATVMLPSVKKLILDIIVTEREAERAALFLRQLLSATPNLEEISIPGSKKYFDDYINVVLGRLILSLNLPRLSSLNFCLAYNPTQMLELANKNFPLKTVILDFAEVHHYAFPNQNLVLERSLQILFAQTAQTLKILHLCFPYFPEHPLHLFTFPEPMVKLSYLALGRFYGSVSILNSLPVIKKLDLWNVRFHDFNYGNQKDLSEKDLGAVPVRYLNITTVIN